jgi:hypothetical protein
MVLHGSEVSKYTPALYFIRYGLGQKAVFFDKILLRGEEVGPGSLSRRTVYAYRKEKPAVALSIVTVLHIHTILSPSLLTSFCALASNI